MLKNLKQKNYKKWELTVELIEICSKNGNLTFHRYLSSPSFQDVFLLILKKVSQGESLSDFCSYPRKGHLDMIECLSKISH